LAIELGEAIALIGSAVPVATVVAHQVASRHGSRLARDLRKHIADDDERFAAGRKEFKKLNETMGLVLFLLATQSRHNEEIIRVANPTAYGEHIEPRIRRFGRESEPVEGGRNDRSRRPGGAGVRMG